MVSRVLRYGGKARHKDCIIKGGRSVKRKIRRRSAVDGNSGHFSPDRMGAPLPRGAERISLVVSCQGVRGGERGGGGGVDKHSLELNFSGYKWDVGKRCDVTGVVRLGIIARSWALRYFHLVLLQKSRNGNSESEGKSI